MFGASQWEKPDHSRGSAWQRASQHRRGPPGLPGAASRDLGPGCAELCSRGGRGKQGPQADSPRFIPCWVSGPEATHSHIHPLPFLASLSSLFQKQALDPDWGSCSRFPSFLSSLPTEAPGSDGLRPCPLAPAYRPL